MRGSRGRNEMAELKLRPDVGGGTSVYVWAAVVALLILAVGAWVAFA